MPVELKKDTREILAKHLGVTTEDVKNAEKNCNGQLFLHPNDLGVFEGFYILHIKIKDGIAPVIIPIDRFQKDANNGSNQKTS